VSNTLAKETMGKGGYRVQESTRTNSQINYLLEIITNQPKNKLLSTKWSSSHEEAPHVWIHPGNEAVMLKNLIQIEDVRVRTVKFHAVSVV